MTQRHIETMPMPNVTKLFDTTLRVLRRAKVVLLLLQDIHRLLKLLGVL